jgi:WD40 repeat protein
MTGHTAPIWNVAIATMPDGHLIAVTCGHDTTLRVWDLTTAIPVGRPLTGHTAGVHAVAIATLPDGRVVAVSGGDDDTVRVWDLTTGRRVGLPVCRADRYRFSC